MGKCCYVCGVEGYKELLVSCMKCESISIHEYCMKSIKFTVSDNWVCEDCQDTPKHAVASKFSDQEPVLKRQVKFIPTNEAIALASKSQDSWLSDGKSHLASPAKSSNAVKMSKKRTANSINVDPLATPTSRCGLPDHFGEKLSNRTSGWPTQKSCKKRCVWEHSPTAVPELSSTKQQSTAEYPVHARGATANSTRRVILYKSEHIKRYKTLKGRKICNTLYLDEGMLDTLGLQEDVKWMAEQIGWTQFLTMKEPTYPLLTREFLSTVKVQIPCGSSTEGRITFRLQNQNRPLTLKEFNSIFGFHNGGDRTKPKEYRANEFWREISDEPYYNPNTSPASTIYNPCFRVMQLLMAHSIFARGKGGRRVVRTDELLHLWAMVQNHNLDTGKFLALHLQSVGKAKSGIIAVGGLVTSIARYLGVNMEGLAQASGNNRIDLNECQARRMIVCHDGRYSLQFKQMSTLWPLPDPASTTVRTRANWKRTFLLGTPHRQQGDAMLMPVAASLEPDSDKTGGSSTSNAADAPEPLIQTLHTMLQAQQCEVEDIRSMVQQMYESHMKQSQFLPQYPSIATATAIYPKDSTQVS